MKQPLTFSIGLLLFLLLVMSGWKSWEQAQAYEDVTLGIIDSLTASSQLEKSGQQLLEILTFGFYDGYSRELEAINAQISLQQAYDESIDLMTMIFGFTAVLLLVIVWLLRRNALDLAYAMLAVAFVSLLVGLSTPILSIEASKELPVLGETVLQYTSKGILSTIEALHIGGYWWLALVLLLFSVIIPLMKTLLGALTLFDQTSPLLERWFHLSHHLGKWSMADVFVVAILVAFFANSGADSLTHAEVRSGLWYFLAYVLLSLIAFQLLAKRYPRVAADSASHS